MEMLKANGAFEEITSQEGQVELFDALDSLSEIERRVVISNELEGETIRHLAETWDVPLNTLLSHKARAMKKLRKQLIRRSI